ncbi:MAG TPA: cupin domain-containing protein, partial [Chromatiales bacterium]|nr:cupin domain-containing protein [Chromatiales bacterium]
KVLRLTLTVCPETAPELEMGDTPFDLDHPARTVAAARQERHATGDRFYQLLVDRRIGCENVTQFIGGIPKSRAPEHYHEYEEAITILEGEGYMHTGDRFAPVGPGSMIFLAKGQRHSLECTSDGGMRLVGIFHPSGSPAVSYE